jgi:phosphoglycolate phosphatase
MSARRWPMTYGSFWKPSGTRKTNFASSRCADQIQLAAAVLHCLYLPESRNMKKAKLLVFDWDGTLMDSKDQIVSCVESAIQELELESRTHDAIKDIIGLGLRESVSTLFPGASDTFVSRFVECYRRRWFATESGKLFPGAKETLQLLHNEGFLLGIATGKGRRGLDRVLVETGLKSVFHATRCADETCSKPQPHMLLEIMGELNVTADETVMIGDTEYDMEMARRAGVKAVAVSYGVHEWQRLQRYDPILMLDQISEITDWLAEQRASAVSEISPAANARR